MKEGYGGRAGTHQFDEKVLIGVRTEDYWIGIAEEYWEANEDTN